MTRGLLVLKSALNKEMEDCSSNRLQCSRFRGFVFHLKVKYPWGDPFLSTSLVKNLVFRATQVKQKTKQKQQIYPEAVTCCYLVLFALTTGADVQSASEFCFRWCCWRIFFLSIMSAYICTCREWHFKGTIPWSIIPWSLLGKPHITSRRRELNLLGDHERKPEASDLQAFRA